MNTQKLYTLTRSLKDQEYELEKLHREINITCDKDYTDGSFVLVVEIPLDENLLRLNSHLTQLLEGTHPLVNYNTFVKEDMWYDVVSKTDREGDSYWLEVRSYRVKTPEENDHIREILLDKEKQLITMCADLKKQIKEMLDEF